MLKKMLAELIGTFFLVFVIGMTAVTGGTAGAYAPIAIGLTLAVMIYAGGHISGAHYNPAVTLAVTLRGKCKVSEVLPYIGSQVFGAALAAFLVAFLRGNDVMSAIQAIQADTVHPLTKAVTPSTFDTVKALVVETIGTFALVWVILNVATAKGTAGNSFYGFAIGTTVMVMAFAVGGISGGAFNPAVAVGLSVMGYFAWKAIWIYLVANLAGAILAALLFNMTHDDKA